jgi:uncharacterized membrane-anchored protein
MIRIWKRDLGTLAVASVRTSKAEFYYWTTILLAQTLGTALGDWTADSAGLGYLGSALIFGLLLLVVCFFLQCKRWVEGTLLF